MKKVRHLPLDVIYCKIIRPPLGGWQFAAPVWDAGTPLPLKIREEESK